jgi:hypothetical protein
MADRNAKPICVEIKSDLGVLASSHAASAYKMRLDYFKRGAEADHFVTFVIVTRGEFEDGEWKGHDEWSFDGAGRVRIDCAGQTNPKMLLNEKPWAARLQADWDIKEAIFIQTRVILAGSCAVIIRGTPK